MQRMDKNGALTEAHHFFIPIFANKPVLQREKCGIASFFRRNMLY
mgnify:CR=1 FL=1